MRYLIFIAVIIAGYSGFQANQWNGLATGVISSIAIGSSLLIFLGQGDDMSIYKKLRFRQSIGGGLTPIICAICLFIGGWKNGWLWIIPGYATGVTIGYLLSRPTINDIEYYSNRMIDSFKVNASENLGYNPDIESIDFLKNNAALSALLWEMIGDAGGKINLGLNDKSKWSWECDYIYNNFVKNENFKTSKPGAHALLRYAVYLCDDPNKPDRCSHPADDM